MQYRKLQGDALFDGRELHEHKVLVLRTDGTVEDVVPAADAGADIEVVKGMLLPGFINCHCHLELSHLKGKIERGQGLVGFLSEVIRSRQVVHAGSREAMVLAEAALYRNGVAGVADIGNTTDAIEVKSRSSIEWFSGVEVLNLRDSSLADRLQHFTAIRDAHENHGLATGLVPHASYSVSGGTFSALNTMTANSILSIHNQESPMEDLLFRQGAGDFLSLYDLLGFPASPLPVSGRSSLQTWLPQFTLGQTIILVHNTFITEEDILFAKDHATRHGLTLFYCVCPGANLYVENALPPLQLLIKHECAIVIGTDSLGSNDQLNIAAEIGTIRKNFPSVPLQQVLQWATSNGAAALRWKHLGGFGKGQKPGIVLMGADYGVQRLV